MRRLTSHLASYLFSKDAFAFSVAQIEKYENIAYLWQPSEKREKMKMECFGRLGIWLESRYRYEASL
jgi:hypothetical protein